MAFRDCVIMKVINQFSRSHSESKPQNITMMTRAVSERSTILINIQILRISTQRQFIAVKLRNEDEKYEYIKIIIN